MWFWCTRTISADVKIAIDYTVQGVTKRKVIKDSVVDKHTSKLEGTFNDWVSFGYYTDSAPIMVGFDCWADTPSAPDVRLRCNHHIF